MSENVAAMMCVRCSAEGVVRIGTWLVGPDDLSYCDQHIDEADPDGAEIRAEMERWV